MSAIDSGHNGIAANCQQNVSGVPHQTLSEVETVTTDSVEPEAPIVALEVKTLWKQVMIKEEVDEVYILEEQT